MQEDPPCANYTMPNRLNSRCNAITDIHTYNDIIASPKSLALGDRGTLNQWQITILTINMELCLEEKINLDSSQT